MLSKRWPWLTVAAVTLLVWLSTFVRIGSGDPRPTGSAVDVEQLSQRNDVNLLFILVDTLRADHLQSYGYERPTSPTLDALASTGVRFAQHLAQSSWTKCSMASLWTGLYPARTRITRFEHVIPEEAIFPAEILRDAGFRTTALYRNGWVSPYFGFAQGFEVYERPSPRPLPAAVRKRNPTIKLGGTDADAVDAAIEFLRIHGHERWFLYLHLMDVHEYVYDDETAVFGSAYEDVYDNAILRENRVLDGLLLHLAEGGYFENTLIAIGSDHGEAFGERGMEGHARGVYRETTEVPFILSFPFKISPGAVVDVPTRNVDIWPTLLELLGLPAMEPSDGRSRVPQILAAIRGESQPGLGTQGIAHLDQNWGRRGALPAPRVAVTEGSLRYVYEHDAQTGRTREQLFDGAADADEVVNVLDERPEVAARLRAAALEYLEDSPSPWPAAPSLEIDEMQLNQLRALGYKIP
jgi:arylsulfatase A-like enzyme